MDFDPSSRKWNCCCCKLSTGLQILATAEMLIAASIAVVATINAVRNNVNPSYFEICLILTTSILAVTSAMLIVGINRFNSNLMYPTLVARMLFIIFVQVFGVSTVVAPHRTHSRWDRENMEKDEPESNVALRLVLLVFAMLIITILVLYCIYLVVRCIQYVKYYCRMKERRESLIQAGMIDPDAGSRRASSLPGVTALLPDR